MSMEVEDELQFWKESLSGISEKLFPRAEIVEQPAKRAKRKPNFTAPERMHLARAYVENVDEYNRGFTAATRGDAKHGRQRLLEKWAVELTAFGVVERTTVEIEQKLRDYMKKIIGNSRRAHRRPLSPAAELLSTVIPQCSTAPSSNSSSNNNNNNNNNNNIDESGSINDPQTEYVDFLLQQHRATSNDSFENSTADVADGCTPTPEPELESSGLGVSTGPTLDLTAHIDETSRIQRYLLSQQLLNARAEHQLKLIAIENAKIDQKLKQIELQKRLLELDTLKQQHQIQLDKFSIIASTSLSNGFNNDNNNNNCNSNTNDINADISDNNNEINKDDSITSNASPNKTKNKPVKLENILNAAVTKRKNTSEVVE